MSNSDKESRKKEFVGLYTNEEFRSRESGARIQLGYSVLLVYESWFKAERF